MTRSAGRGPVAPAVVLGPTVCASRLGVPLVVDMSEIPRAWLDGLSAAPAVDLLSCVDALLPCCSLAPVLGVVPSGLGGWAGVGGAPAATGQGRAAWVRAEAGRHGCPSSRVQGEWGIRSTGMACLHVGQTYAGS